MSNYTSRASVELVFGTLNVARWADLDGDGDEVKTNARVEHCCNLAGAEIEDLLRQRRYKFPLIKSFTLCDLVTKMAGLHLHDSRGIIDNTSTEADSVSRIRKEVEQKLTQIRTGEIYLEGDRYSNAPNVVQDKSMKAEESIPTATNFDPFKPYFGQKLY